jgi:hypothetical protein
MKSIIFVILWTAVSALASPPDDLLSRVKIGESIFDERFPVARIERILSNGLDAEIAQLEKGPAQPYVAKIRKIIGDVSRDVGASTAFKDQYAGWLATQLTKDELQAYLDFLRSDLAKKISNLDDRVQPLFVEAVQRKSKGRLESIPLLLAEARSQ